MSEKKRGGKRINAGRKKYDNPDDYKTDITIYVKKSKVKEKGGKSALKHELLRYVDNC